MRVILVAVVAALASTLGCRAHSDPIRDFSLSTNLEDIAGPGAEVSIGDLDGDGDLDVVQMMGRHEEAVARVFLNGGQARFTARPLRSAGDPSFGVRLADLDADGDLDIVGANDRAAKWIYFNDGRATFEQREQWGVAGWPSRGVEVADLNGDGRPDIVVANRSPRSGERTAFCLNEGGHFRTCQELEVGPASGLDVADMNRDGHVDLVVPARDGGRNLVLFNDGRAGFSRSLAFGPEATVASSSAVGDLNGDGWPDVILGDERIGTFVFLNDGQGLLQDGLQISFDDLTYSRAIEVADLNRDGHVDIVIGYVGQRGSVLFNDGTGRSFRHIRFGGYDHVGGIGLGDLDGDGYPEIVISRVGAPPVMYFNRSGLGVDTVIASSARRGIPVNLALFAPKPMDASQPLVGTWRGRAQQSRGYHYDLDLEVFRLQAGGQSAGTALRSDYGVPYCVAILRLPQREPDGRFRFSESPGAGCPFQDAVVYLKLLNQDQLEWERRPVAPDQATARGVLQRKRD